MIRAALIIACTIFLFISSHAAAQEINPARIGLLVVPERGKPVEAFYQALRELGYIEGRNLIIEFRSAGGRTKPLRGLAKELVALGLDVIVTHSVPGIRSVRKETSTIPIVMAVVGNPVKSGFIESVARPGGNVTGNSFFGTEMAIKRIEVLKEALPSVTKMALLAHPSHPEASRHRAEAAIRSLGIEAQVHFADGRGSFDRVFSAMKQRRAGALQILASPVFWAGQAALIEHAARYGVPTIYPWRVATRRGGLMSYGPDITALFRRAAFFVDKILKGARPADLPVERPTKFDFVVNLKTAKALGITFPRSILLRATEVIE